jgi:hypothetical protein
MKLLSLFLTAFLLAACVSRPMSGDSLDEIATDYVQMTLEIGEREPGYVDAYYGPKEWADAAKSAPRSVQDLAKEANALSERVSAIDVAGWIRWSGAAANSSSLSSALLKPACA